MILIPYFIDYRNQNWIKFGVFLSSGGRETWSIEDKTEKKITKILKDNGFPLSELNIQKGVIYAKIDYEKLNLTEFYTWEEVDPKTSNEDTWRILSIPKSLWTCPVFKEKFWISANLPIAIQSEISI
jgi:hypothetical protein